MTNRDRQHTKAMRLINLAKVVEGNSELERRLSRLNFTDSAWLAHVSDRFRRLDLSAFVVRSVSCACSVVVLSLVHYRFCVLLFLNVTVFFSRSQHGCVFRVS